MSFFRVIILVSAVSTLSGAWWLARNGIGGESTDVSRSIRAGSAGNTFLSTSVK